MPDDATPIFDRCPECGREGRSIDVANLTGTTGTGDRVLPLRSLELELATHVGAATLAADELDAAMSALCGLGGAVTLDEVSKTWGRSGTELICELRKLVTGPELNADRRQELRALCDRYDALYLVRNDVIHSFRPGRSTERLDVVRAMRSTKANPITTTSHSCS